MTGNTHREFSVAFVLIGSMLLYKTPVREVNYYLLLMVMIMSGKVGGRFADIDHIWQNVREKSTWVWVVNKLIHLTGGKHRSRHTHSWDIFMISWVVLRTLVTYGVKINYFSDADRIIACAIIDGFMLGWFSHLFSDSLTHDGTYPSCFSKRRSVKLVPKAVNSVALALTGVIIMVISFGVYILELKIGVKVVGESALFTFGLGGAFLIYMALKVGNMRFNTGNEWELFVFKNIRRANKALGLIAILVPVIYKYNTDILNILKNILT